MSTCPTCHQPLPTSPMEATSASHGLLDLPDAGGWLVADTRRRYASPFRYGADHSLVEPVELVVAHYSASPPESASSERRRLAEWFSGKRSRTSTHFAITRDGTIIQGVPLTDRAWHVAAEYEGRPVNGRSIGFDFMNVGWLTRRGGVFTDSYGKTYTGPKPVQAPDKTGLMRWWEPVTEAQMQAASALLTRLGRWSSALRVPGALIHHSDAQANRLDAGPTVDRARLEAALRAG